MAYRGSRNIAPLILNLGTRWRLVIKLRLRLLYPWEEALYTLARKLGGPQSWFKEKNVMTAPEFELRNFQFVA